MKEHDNFIQAYKALEQALERPVKEYEDTLDEEQAQKLRLCRNVRNYIQHHADYESFIRIHPEMIEFLKDTLLKYQLKGGCLKDVYETAARYGFLHTVDTLQDAAVLLQKKKAEGRVVLDKNGAFFGYFSALDICNVLASGEYKKTAKIEKYVIQKGQKDFAVLLVDMPLSRAEKEMAGKAGALVVNKSGKICGFWNGTV